MPAWLALPLGLGTGIILGALGGGGAIIAIPLLIFVLGMPAHEATAASLVIVGLSSLTTLPGHLRRATVRVREGLLIAGIGTTGTWVGSTLSVRVPDRVLLILLSVLLVVVSIVMAMRAREGEADRSCEAQARVQPAQALTPGRLGRVVLVAVAIGLLTGFFGVGGGFAIVPALTLLLGYPMASAVGTSLLVIAINSATALVSRLGAGLTLDWAIVALFTAATMAGAFLGGWVGRRSSPALLTRAFAWLLAAIALLMLVRGLTAASA